MGERPKMWRVTITSTHVMAVRGVPADSEEEARERALEAQFDDYNVEHLDDVVHGVDAQEEEA